MPVHQAFYGQRQALQALCLECEETGGGPANRGGPRYGVPPGTARYKPGGLAGY